MQRLILASSSKPRKMLLERLQIPFEVVVPDVDETPYPNESPEELVVRLAQLKASVVAVTVPDALVIGADLVGVLDSAILCKPLTREKAIEQLQMMSGKTVTFYIGVCLYDAKNKTMQSVKETFTATFRALSLTEIQAYLDKEDVLQCAGSVKIEGLGIALMEKLSGNDFTALIGLPLIQLTTMLKQAGYSVLG